MEILLTSIAFTLSGLFLLAVTRELEREKAHSCITLAFRAAALVAGAVGLFALIGSVLL